MNSADERWVVDVGNSRTAFGRLDADGRLTAVWRADTADSGVLPPWPRPEEADGVAVVASARERIDAALKALGTVAPSWWGTEPLPVPMRHTYAQPARPGPDRLVAAYEAFSRAGRALVVVDAGSALTCDVVDANGRFLGGAIAPGFAALRAALRSAAPALPEARIGAPAAYPAASTAEAVEYGVSAAARGMAAELLRAADLVVGPDAPVFVAGGDAARVAEYLSGRRLEVVPELVLEGVARLATCRIQRPRPSSP